MTETTTSADILGNALADAAARGIAAGRDGTAVDLTAKGIALMVLTDMDLGERVVIHSHRFAKAQAEAAVEIVAAQRAESRRIDQILGVDAPGNRERVVNSIDLGAGTWVVEVTNGPFSGKVPFTVIHDSKASHIYFTSLDEALLYAVERRAGGDVDSRGYVFAARALGVKTAFNA